MAVVLWGPGMWGSALDNQGSRSGGPSSPFSGCPFVNRSGLPRNHLREKGVSVAMVFFCLSSIFRTAMVSG